MSIDDIRNAVKITDNALTVTAATFEHAGGITWLLGEYFPDSTMVMKPAALHSGPKDDFVLVKGDLRLLGVNMPGAEVRFTWTGSNAAMAVSGALPAGWRFADSFASLAGNYLNDLNLTVPTISLISEPADGRGLTLTAGYQPPAFWELLNWFADTSKDATLSGLILLDGGHPVMTLSVAPDIQAKLGGYLDINLKLQHLVRAYPLPKAPSKRGISVISQLVGAIGFTHEGKQIEVPLAALFSKDTGVLKLRLNTAKVFDLGLSEIAHWFKGLDLHTQALPDSYRPSIPFTLHDVVFAIGLRTRTLEYVSLSIQSTAPWVIIDKVLELDSLAIDIMVMHPAKKPDPLVTITGKVKLSSVILEVFAQVPDFHIEGHLAEGSAVDLSPLIQHHLGTGHGVPDTLKISDLRFSAYPAGKSYSFAIGAEGSWEILTGLILDGISVAITYEGMGEDAAVGVEVHATFEIGGVPVNVSAVKTGEVDAGWLFTGTAGTGQGVPIGKLSEVVADLASKLGIRDLPAVPTELDVTLQSLSVSFHTGKKELVLVAETALGSRGIVVVSAANTTKVGVLVDMKITIDKKKFGVSSLPLVGETIAAIEDVGIDSLQVIITSQQFDPTEIGELNAIIGSSKGLPTPKDGLAKGAQLGVTFFIGEKVQPPLTFQLTGASKQPPKEQLRSLGAAPPAAGPPPEAWLDIQRSFGPVNIKRIGIGYSSPNAVLMLDASLVLSGLTLDMEGLGLQFPLKDPLNHITPNLRGMSLTYQSGPLEISGGFLNITPPPQGLRYEYNGELLIQAEGFGLSAIGSFAEFKSPEGSKSLFLFGVLNATLGGPAFFVVTGIAAGFGYNRGLTIPTLDQLPGFPLVAAAMPTAKNPSPFSGDKATDPAQAMEVINNWVYPALGQNWLAAGIKFTSFEILESFALLTVSFGNRFEIALLGLSSLTMPPLAPKPVGYAQLALEVTYAPDDGVLKVAAQLTPESYILSEACHLTGGFALYTWFKAIEKDEVHAGDFVVSLGGYSPYFKKPAGYPSVPRVGANWQVSDNLTIKGGFYFALTPVAVMAGGALEANFVSGNFKAWFTAKADFLLYWEPFHYLANLSLSLGASYTLGSGTTAWTITVHVGVDVTLHGPPFGGTAVIDLYIFSIAIDFGPKDSTPQTLSWEEFKSHYLLPKDQHQSGGVTPHALVAETQSDAICFSRVSGGLIKELPPDPQHQAPDWIMNPEKFEIVTSSKIPCSKANLVQSIGKQSSTQVVGAKQISNEFGVTACGIGNGVLTSIHTITWHTDDGGPVNWAIPSTPTGKDDVLPAVTSRLPRAAWFKDAKTDPTQPPSMAMINGDRVTDELTTGFRLKPAVAKPDETLPIKVANLEVELTTINEKNGVVRSWANPTLPKTDDKHESPATRMAELAKVDTNTVREKRNKIVSALQRQGSIVAATTDTKYLAFAAQYSELLAAPILCSLGERNR
jgi:hypothetical protein